jgi:hypothetical protein
VGGHDIRVEPEASLIPLGEGPDIRVEGTEIVEQTDPVRIEDNAAGEEEEDGGDREDDGDAGPAAAASRLQADVRGQQARVAIGAVVGGESAAQIEGMVRGSAARRDIQKRRAQDRDEEMPHAARKIQASIRGRAMRLSTIAMMEHEERALSEMNHPDRRKLKRIVAALDADQSGVVSAAEVKILFSGLLEVPVEDIDSEDEEVLEFAGLTQSAMVEALMQDLSREQVDEYFALLFPREVALAQKPPQTKAVQDVPRRPLVEALSHTVALDQTGEGEPRPPNHVPTEEHAAWREHYRELHGMKVSALRGYALAAGVPAEDVDDAYDAEVPKQAMAQLILAHKWASVATNQEDESPEEARAAPIANADEEDPSSPDATPCAPRSIFQQAPDVDKMCLIVHHLDANADGGSQSPLHPTLRHPSRRDP